MGITLKDIKAIKMDLAKLKPAKLSFAPDQELTNKEIILALAPALERMKRRGFGMDEILKHLKERGINVSASTMNRYLNEAKRAVIDKGEELSSLNGPNTLK